MTERLYKVSAPRDDWTFHPRPFWRSEDWSSSDDHPREDHVRDCVLYAGTFDEVNIHLFPKVWRLRVWLDSDTRAERLRNLGYNWSDNSCAVIFAEHGDREVIESFEPTVFTFDGDGFELTPSNEHISREPRTAVSCETLSFREARERWAFELLYVDSIKALAESFRSAGIDHQIQT
jgi:hypothetical protein